MKTTIVKSIIAGSIVLMFGITACNNKGENTDNDTETYETTMEDNSNNETNMGSADTLGMDTTYHATPDHTMTDTSHNMR